MISLAEQFSLKPTPSSKRRRRQKRAGDGKHHVYFVRLNAGGLIKIGFTISIKNRLFNMANELGVHRDEIDVLGYLSVPMGQGRKLEQALHSELAAHRVEGEWFDVEHVNLMHVALSAARQIIDGEWSVSGLAADETYDFAREKWVMTRGEARHLVRRK